MSTNKKEWKCKNGHALGMVERVKSGERYMSRLSLLPGAVDRVSMQGATLRVRCSTPGCQAERAWIIGEAELDALIEKVTAPRLAAAEV